jgi:mono/diheme cytochrome c family protein
MAARAAMLLLALPSSFALAQIADAERGRMLYENHCQFCHTPQVHSRPNKPSLSRGEVSGIVDQWQRQQNLAWSRQDVADVMEYLSRTRYRFAPDK